MYRIRRVTGGENGGPHQYQIESFDMDHPSAEDETEVHRALARLYSPFVDLTPLFAEIVTDLR
eukprot:COSAG05_NODE_12419_length_468_cov_2.737127_1_plen_62_part_01